MNFHDHVYIRVSANRKLALTFLYSEFCPSMKNQMLAILRKRTAVMLQKSNTKSEVRLLNNKVTILEQVTMGGGDGLENINPKLYSKCESREVTPGEEDDDVTDEFDSREIFDLIRGINDPEHPLTLEELNVVEQSHVEVDNDHNIVNITFTPTIPHCSMATLIGLSIRVQLLRALPSRFKVSVKISPGTHASEGAVNKQLADKERVAAALENIHLIEVINQCIAGPLNR